MTILMLNMALHFKFIYNKKKDYDNPNNPIDYVLTFHSAKIPPTFFAHFGDDFCWDLKPILLRGPLFVYFIL